MVNYMRKFICFQAEIVFGNSGNSFYRNLSSSRSTSGIFFTVGC